MKETIYTIPVNDAFNSESECPLCDMYKRFQEDNINYFLGPSLMQPENRIETNDKGFCRKHFQMLLDSRANRLGLGLVIDTYIEKQSEHMVKLAKKPEDLIKYLKEHQEKCCICEKLDYTMERYIEVILQQWHKDEAFRAKFNNSKGFCTEHFTMMLEGAQKYLGRFTRKEFAAELINLQLKNIKRIKEDVNWFTKKFDYRFKDEPWKNSKDALERSTGKIVGY
ncbi:MAG: ABC transporter substrate-binding protein [Ruminococcaceae bacterium]|nr:ABC transporter substrate-binding protein [Oscillospiraceae bacterium]